VWVSRINEKAHNSEAAHKKNFFKYSPFSGTFLMSQHSSPRTWGYTFVRLDSEAFLSSKCSLGRKSGSEKQCDYTVLSRNYAIASNMIFFNKIRRFSSCSILRCDSMVGNHMQRKGKGIPTDSLSLHTYRTRMFHELASGDRATGNPLAAASDS
jgi:hypothetical protein